MSAFLLNDKVEAGLVAIVRGAVVDAAVMIVPGKSGGDLARPVVICGCDGEGMADPPGTGNFQVNAYVAVEYEVSEGDGGAAGKAAMQALVSDVFSAVQVGDLAEKLTAAVADLTVFPTSVQFGAPESERLESGAWVDRLPMRLYACGSALS